MNGSGGSSVTALVLCALGLELGAVRACLDPIGSVRHRAGTIFEVGRLDHSGHRVISALTGVGNHAAAIVAERAIAQFEPDLLLSVGVAGALRTDIRRGDVVVATRVYAYQNGRAEPDGFMGAPQCWEASHELCQLAHQLELTGTWRRRIAVPAGHRWPRVHFAGIAAGDVVVNSSTAPILRRLRRSFSDAAAVEMEGAGTAHAAHLNRRLPVLTIRGIADHADGGKYVSDAAGWQPVAARNAAAFAMALIGAW